MTPLSLCLSILSEVSLEEWSQQGGSPLSDNQISAAAIFAGLSSQFKVTIHYFASVSAKISNESSLPLIAQVQGQFLFQEFPFSILTARSGIMSSSNAGVNAGQIGGPVASAHFDVGLAALSIPNSFDYFTGSPRTFSLQEQINQYHLDVTALASPWVVESRTGIAQISIDYTYTAAATPPTSVPEPGSFALVALSMGALGFVRLRRVGGRAHVASQSSLG
ncbi:MAG: PEP-CTERM sorting domain-containing protein [Burkholderiales bacterium]|nr:PEP-CTERM sorting domain-containing protein [Burkholderiales bacterium]